MVRPPNGNNHLSSEDFNLFWKWLTYVKGSSVVAKRAERIKIIRVFATLDCFKSNAEIVDYVKSWDCENEHTVFAHELKIGLCRLNTTQFKAFYRFIVALQEKEAEEKLKAEEKRAKLEKQIKKEAQQAVAYAARKEKQKSSRSFGRPSRVMPIDSDDDDGNDNDEEKESTYEANKIQAFKEKHCLKEKKKSSGTFGILVNFVRTISERSFDAFRSSSTRRLSSQSSSGSSIYPSSSSSIVKTISSESDAISTCSDDGFTQRLSRANLSIFREEVCGNDAILSYRLLEESSEIDESLVSFDSCDQGSSLNPSLQCFSHSYEH